MTAMIKNSSTMIWLCITTCNYLPYLCFLCLKFKSSTSNVNALYDKKLPLYSYNIIFNHLSMTSQNSMTFEAKIMRTIIFFR